MKDFGHAQKGLFIDAVQRETDEFETVGGSTCSRAEEFLESSCFAMKMFCHEFLALQTESRKSRRVVKNSGIAIEADVLHWVLILIFH